MIERNQRECPLCHMEYRDCEELVGKIEEDKNKDTELQRIDSQIQKNKQKLQEIESSIKEMEKEVNEKISAILIEYNERYSNEKSKISKLQKTIEKYNYCIDNSQNLCKSIDEKYLEEGIIISNINMVKNNEEKIEKDKKVLKDNLEKDLIKIRDFRIKLVVIIKNIAENDLKILEIKGKIGKIKGEPLYVDVKQFLERSDFYKSEYSYAEIKEMVIKEHKNLLQKVNELDLKIEKYQTEVAETKEDYQSKLNILLKEINEINMYLDEYCLRCKDVIGVIENDEDIFSKITQKQDEIESKLKVIGEKMQGENNILILLGNLKEQKMWLDRNYVWKLNKEKLKFLNQRIEKLVERKGFK